MTAMRAAAPADAHSRFGSLDAMRGVAAVAVVFYHLNTNFPLGAYTPRYGHLAVDLFFALSGFVLSYSNDGRFSRERYAGRFMLRRWLRLYPLMALGIVLGVLTAPLLALSPKAAQWLPLSFMMNAAMLPSLGYNTFSFDAPEWSLFFEFWIANAIFAVGWKYLKGRWLLALLAVSFGGLLISEHIFQHFHVGYVRRNFLGGFPRVGFSFFAGVALAHFHRRRPPRVRLPSWLIVSGTVAALFMPLATPFFLYENLFVLVGSPILIYFGASALERNPRLGAALGDTSYALYAVHWPLMTVAAAVAGASGFRCGLASQVLLTFTLACAAYAAHHWYDVPARRWLGRQLGLQSPTLKLSSSALPYAPDPT